MSSVDGHPKRKAERVVQNWNLSSSEYFKCFLTEKFYFLTAYITHSDFFLEEFHYLFRKE